MSICPFIVIAKITRTIIDIAKKPERASGKKEQPIVIQNQVQREVPSENKNEKSKALEHLHLRYVKGEITKEQYKEMKEDLEG